MRRFFFLMLAGTLFFFACSKEQLTTTEQSASVSDLSLKITSYVADNYPDATIESVSTLTNSDATTLVTLNTTEELAFDKNDDFIGDGRQYHHCDSIADDSLHNGNGHHGGGHHGGGHHGGGQGCGNHGNPISIDSLNASILSYIATNFPLDTIRHAEIDTNCEFGVITEVIIFGSDIPMTKLVFDASNTFVYQSVRIDYADLPQVVKDYIAAGYAGYNVKQKSGQHILTDGSLEYSVYVSLQSTHKKIIIKADGTFVCEQ